jgi:hypothetical protein
VQGKFNFKVKVIQADLSGGDYFYNGGGCFRDESPSAVIYENSSYISKLFFINNVSGGIIAKEKVEDMPEKYRRFVSLDMPSEAEMLRSWKRELAVLANREEVGQNVFYNSLSGSGQSAASHDAPPAQKSGSGSESDSKAGPGLDTLLNRLQSFLGSDDSDEFDGFDGFDIFDDFDEFDEFGEYDEFDEYENDDEIRDILHLNHYYNSEAYKMSKVEYDYNSIGTISLTGNGALDIIYDESEMTGFKDSYVRFLFDPGEKNIVTMCRKNFFESWLTFEKGKRISIDRSGGYPGTFSTATTKELVNNMTIDGGEMRFVYLTETNGVPSEMITHTIEAARLES